jgi:uncharacterized protein YlzI (FlbEa/FlbD family)
MRLIALTRQNYHPGATIYVNPEQIAAVEVVAPDPSDEFNEPTTEITLANGHSIYVQDSPDDIARWAMRGQPGWEE